jgi:transposase-like protein
MQAKNRYANGTRAVMVHEADPEVLPKAERRQFSADYKLRVLAEADRCSEPGQIGALMRREGLYSSHLSKWRQQRERGALGQQRGRKADPQTAELKRLQRENERLRSRLERAEHIIEVQKKLAELLGTSLNEIPSNEQR